MKKLAIVSIAFLSLFLLNSLTASAATTLTNGLVSYWPLNESSGSTASDVAGGGNNGTNYNVSQNASGKIGSAYSFNGASSNVNMGNSSNLSITSSGTVSAWVYLPSYPTHDGLIVGKGDWSYDRNGYLIVYLASVHRFATELANGTSSESVNFANVNVTPGNWYHLVLSWNGTTATTYINGISATTPQTLTPVSNLYNFAIGQNMIHSPSNLLGTVDEVGVWNRQLTSTEVASLYNSGAGVSYPFEGGTISSSSINSGLVSYWPLNESSGSTASDIAGGGNNGTNHNLIGANGKVGGAYSLNGSNSYVDMGNKSNLSLSSTGSISTWIYPTDVTHMGMIVSKGNPGSDLNGYTLGFNYNTLYWELASSSAHIDGGIPLSGNISNNNWYLVTLAWDGSHVNLYLNGNLVSTTPQTLTPSSSTYPFRIGARGDYLGSSLFKGNIDEVGVWNRALSQTEIASIYNSGSGVSYPFGGGSGTLTAGAGSNQVLPSGTYSTTLTGSGTDSGGSITSYTWTQNSGPSTAVISSPSSSTTKVSFPTSGTYNFKLYITDNNGQTAYDTVTVVVSNINDTTPPSISITSPTSGATVSGLLPITVNAKPAALAIAKVEFYTDVSTSVPFTTTTVSPYSTNLDTTKLSPGTHTILARAYDTTGNYGVATASILVGSGVCEVPPNVSITSPSSGSTVSGIVPVSVSASLCGAVTKVEFYTDVSPNTPIATVTSSPYSTTLNTTTYSNATHTIFAKAYDAVGNTSSAVVSISVSNAPVSGNNLTIQGTSKTITATGTDYGINVPRTSPTNFKFLNNYVSSSATDGYVLVAGDEDVASTNNNLSGEVISGNYFNWNGSGVPKSITHGVFTGYNTNALIDYNYVNKVPMSIIRKSNGMTNTSGGVAYNIVNDPLATAVVVKGMQNVNIYNNTFYSTQPTYNGTSGTWRGLIDVYENTDITPMGPTTGTHIFNNIFYTKNQILNINVYETADLANFQSDYNVFYCESGTPLFQIAGTTYTFSQWQAMGYDTHSKVINPNFKDFTSFVPTSPLNYGTNLGSTWQTGLASNASWSISAMPATTNQGSTWQVGAIIVGGSTVVTPPTPSIVTAGAGSNQTLASGITQATLTGTATTTSGTISSYKWSQNSGPTVTISSPNSASTSIYGLSSGNSYNFTLTATDSNGSTGTDTVSVAVAAVVSTPPSISITSPYNGSTVSGTIPVIVTASSATSTITKVEFYTDVSPNTPIATVTSSPYSTTLNTTTYSNATHTIFAKAYDAAGNTGSATVSITTSNIIGPSTTPSIQASSTTIVLPTNSVTLTASGGGPYTWSKFYDQTLPINSATLQQSTPPIDNANFSSTTGNSITVSNMDQGTWYYQVTNSSGTARIVINVDTYAQPANSTQFLKLPITDSSYINGTGGYTGVNNRNYTGVNGKQTDFSFSLGGANAELWRDAQELSMIDSMKGKQYFSIKDGFGGNNAAGGFAIVGAYGVSEKPGQVYVYEWKGYLDQPFSLLTAGANPNSGDVLFFENHASQSILGLSNSLGVAYLAGDSLGVFESIGCPGDSNINGVGTTMNLLPAGCGHDHYSPAFAKIDDFYNKAHTLRFTIKQGDNGTGAFQKVEYDGKQVYLRNTGNIGQTYKYPVGDYPVFGQIYDNDQKFTTTSNTSRHREASAVLEKFIGYQMSGNNPPLVNAGSNQSISGTTATLDGSYSRDDGGYIASLSWSQVSGPSTASISNANQYIANVSGLTKGTYTFRLTATDNNNATSSNTVIVTVN